MQSACAAIDWGTSRFRIWILDRTGAVLAEHQNDRGMSTLQPSEYEQVLEAGLQTTGAQDGLPAILCGMVGSAQGWKEAPYADLPVRPADIADAAIRVPSANRDIRILPGLAQRDPAGPDVMRGEETLLMGIALTERLSGTICLPGTHSKWVWAEDGAVTGFHTAMTGELYGLLAKHSTLSHAIAEADHVDCEHPAFTAGLVQAMAHPDTISRALFSVRAAPLLGLAPRDAMAARLSGLLIGLEISGMHLAPENPVTLVAQGALALLYERALTLAGAGVRTLDADDMVRAGLFAAANGFWHF